MFPGFCLRFHVQLSIPIDLKELVGPPNAKISARCLFFFRGS